MDKAMKVLLTGSTGYIGGRLAAILLEDPDVRLRLFVRNKKKVHFTPSDKLEIFEGNALDKESLFEALSGIDVAYYLIHSMGSKADYSELDRSIATNFRDACIRAGVKRIIYLGGLGVKETASKHLLSRLETGEILSAKPDRIQTIFFRAGVIIGSGSASFEIIRNLVQKLPVMTTPRFVHTQTQPISVYDVLAYLSQAKDLEARSNLIVDIGSQQMSFKDMLQRTAKIMGLKRLIIPVPVFTPKLSSHWLVFITSVPSRIGRALVEGLRSETVIQNDNARKFFPDIHPVSFDEAIQRALDEVEKNQVLDHWCDSITQEVCDIRDEDRAAKAVFRHVQTVHFEGLSPQKVFDAAQSIGGENGWFRLDWLWNARGLVDRILGGPGLRRGRRDPKNLEIGDDLDFWKVTDIKEGKRILLFNQMMVPGKAWLEFAIADETLTQTAHFLPKGLWGRLYWWLTTPFHLFVFKDIASGIVKRAKDAP
jgi:uncharacterized protein YbjT (DUF2867 family)